MMSIKTKLVVFLEVFIDRFRTKGWLWALKGVAKRFIREGLWLTLLPLSAIAHLLGIRRLLVRVEHIGHLAVEPDTLLKDLALGRLRRKRWLLLAPDGRVANSHMLAYWEKHLRVVRQPALCYLIETISWRIVMRDDLSRYDSMFFGRQPVYLVNKLWGSRAPLLTLSIDDEKWSEDMLPRLGIDAGRWFVCVHVREGGFFPGNEVIQAHRNASIENCIPAMAEIVRRGGVCVRMGDRSMAKLPQLPGVIDYAHHPLKSSRYDVVLCAKARFFLGCTSGLAFVSMVFGVPIAHANMIPVETLGLRYCDISMPKLIQDEKTGRYLKFAEILSSQIGGFFFSHQYRTKSLCVEENDEEDMVGLVVDMLDAIEGRSVFQEDGVRLEQEYLALFRLGHYSYPVGSRVSQRFLLRHRDLLS